MELEAREVTKLFGSFKAVNSVSFAAEKGELFSIVGPSGCGKTTILRMIAGFIYADGGQIILNGQDITFAPVNKRNTAMVFQNYALFPHMNVFDNIAFGLRMHKVPPPEIKERVRDVLDLIGLPDLAERYVAQLSGGQQQRIALARALVIRPQILLLDEPLSNLDANLRERLRIEIREIQQKVGITTIFVTHDIAEAFAMSDRIAVMSVGQIAQISDPTTIYERPTSQFVGAFVGKTNHFKGPLEHLENGQFAARISKDMAICFNYTGQFRDGLEVTLMVRPERIQVSAQPTGSPNSFPGVVREVFYLGSNTRYVVDMAGNNLAIERQNGTSQRFMQGDRVFVEWGDQDCVWYI